MACDRRRAAQRQAKSSQTDENESSSKGEEPIDEA